MDTNNDVNNDTNNFGNMNFVGDDATTSVTPQTDNDMPLVADTDEESASEEADNAEVEASTVPDATAAVDPGAFGAEGEALEQEEQEEQNTEAVSEEDLIPGM